MSQATKHADLAVLGAGPAGLSLAKACANLGLDVVLIAPDLESLWPRSYGTFAQSLSDPTLAPAVQRCFETLLVHGSNTPQRLATAYVRFDTARLQTLLLEQARESGVRFLEASVARLEHGTTSSAIHLEPGSASRSTPLHARLVVDATGSNSHFSRRTRRVPAGFQSAYGEWIEVDEPLYPDGAMSLMDFRPLSSGAPEPVTFLYAMPETERRWFVQETSLAAKKPIEMGVLQERLATRLRDLGVVSHRVLGHERCLIPLGVGLPVLGDDVLPYGAAAGMVHPATGYQLARAIERAPAVAKSLSDSRDEPRGVRLERALGAMWPTPERTSFTMYEHGLGTLMSLDAKSLRAFIGAFFSLPEPEWLGFMAGTAEPKEVARTMWRVFTKAPTSLRLQLLRGGTRSGASALFSAFS